MQVDRAAGQGASLLLEDSPPGLQGLIADKPATLVAPADAKYDKIVHVRQAANRAIEGLEGLPDPPPVSKNSAASAAAVQDLLGGLDVDDRGTELDAGAEDESSR